MKVEVFYIDGCPNYQPAVKQVNELLQEFRLTGNVLEVPVPDSASAVAVRFLGSPTIRVNGVDIEPSSRTSNPAARFPGLLAIRSKDTSPEVALRRHWHQDLIDTFEKLGLSDESIDCGGALGPSSRSAAMACAGQLASTADVTLFPCAWLAP